MATNIFFFVPQARYLLFRGASVEGRDANEWTPLHYAALTGSVEMIESLVKAGADVEAYDLVHNSHLCFGHQTNVFYFFRLNASAKSKSVAHSSHTRFTFTALHARSSNNTCLIPKGSLGAADSLVKAGSGIFAVDREGANPYTVSFT